MVLFLSIKSKSNFLWFLLPIVMVLAFLSMHVPATYINFIIIICLFIYFILNFNLSKIIYFIIGSIFILTITILFFVYFDIPFMNFIQQYILFPMSMGEYRLSNTDYEYSLSANFTFRRVIGHFKFIHVFILFIIASLLIILINNKKDFNKREDLLIYVPTIFVTILIIFHQLITANQTFIFSIIPILAGFSHILLKKYHSTKIFYQFFFVTLVVFVTVKYHAEYNAKRKFMDLQNVDLSIAANANLIDSKFSKLKWITPFFSGTPEEEINLLKQVIEIIRSDKREKMVITPYQFFSIVLEEDLNIPNRWYGHENASYPYVGHKYHKFYKKHFSNKIKDNNIEVIYTVGFPKVEDFNSYVNNICFEKIKINEISSVNNLIKCQ